MNEHWKQLKGIRLILKPFTEYTQFVSRTQPSIQLSAHMYLQLENTLKGISKREGVYAEFDSTLVEAAKYGLEKFNEYNGYIKGNDIYYIASVLDP